MIDYGLGKTESKNEEEKKYAFVELKVAINIAFGHHGFGEKFTAENPFIIVVVSGNEAELNSLKKEIAQTIAQDEETKIHADKIKIDGFVKK